LNQVGFAVQRQLAVSVLSSIREKLYNLLDEFSWYPFNLFHNDLDPAWPCLSCINVTVPSDYGGVVRTLDTFPLVRPFLPISYKNISDSSLWRSDEQLFLRPSLPFAARFLDRVAAEMYLGVERFVEWNFDSFVTLLWNAAEVSSNFVMETIVWYMMYDSIEEYSCQQIAFYFIVTGMVGPLSRCKLQPFE
jgi:hypothetical protein